MPYRIIGAATGYDTGAAILGRRQQRRDFNETTQVLAGIFFWPTPHPRMPDMSLTRSEANVDLAAYIKTQK